MFKWLRKTALWIIGVPIMTLYLGAGLNQVVLYANHDRFPVTINDARLFEYKLELKEAAEEGDDRAAIRLEELQHGYLDDEHVIATSETKLNWLADWIDLHGDIYSPGDVVLYLGDTGMTYSPFFWAAVVIGRLAKKEE